MAKGAPGAASTIVPRGSGGAASAGGSPASPPRGAAGGMRRRHTGRTPASSGAKYNSTGMNMLRFYTDDAPGLKIAPVTVLVMSVGFIAFVTALHIVGKLYNLRG